jgi:hypothetical protein
MSIVQLVERNVVPVSDPCDLFLWNQLSQPVQFELVPNSWMATECSLYRVVDLTILVLLPRRICDTPESDPGPVICFPAKLSFNI